MSEYFSISPKSLVFLHCIAYGGVVKTDINNKTTVARQHNWCKQECSLVLWICHHSRRPLLLWSLSLGKANGIFFVEGGTAGLVSGTTVDFAGLLGWTGVVPGSGGGLGEVVHWSPLTLVLSSRVTVVDWSAVSMGMISLMGLPKIHWAGDSLVLVSGVFWCCSMPCWNALVLRLPLGLVLLVFSCLTVFTPISVLQFECGNATENRR